MHHGSWTSWTVWSRIALPIGLAAACSSNTPTEAGGSAVDSGTPGSGSSGGMSSSGSEGSGSVSGSSGTGSGAGSSGGGASGSSSGSSGSGSSTSSGSATGSTSGTPAGTDGGIDGSVEAGPDAATSDATAPDSNQRKLLLHDEGLFHLTYVDLGNPTPLRWSVTVPDGNDMQLVGAGRVMMGTGNGYEEHDVATGAKVAELTTFPGTLSAHRLRTRNTLLAGVNWQGAQGIVLVEVNAAGAIQRTIVYRGFTYVRLVRETPQGTFLVTSNHTVFEGQADGTILWQTVLASTPVLTNMNAWKALRLASGETLVSTGYGASFQILGADHSVRQTITGPVSVAPYFFGNFEVLPSGNFIVANWEGHGAGSGNKGHQLLELNPRGTLVWSWKQDPAYVSSIQDVIVLDGLDVSRLYVEDTTGMLVPAP